MNLDEMNSKQAQALAADSASAVPVAESVGTTDPVAEPATPVVPEAESGGDTVDPESQPTAAENNVEAPDFGKFLEESSGGLFKSVEDFTSSLDKIKNYDKLQARVQELENKNPYANDYVKKLNALYAEGKTQEQIDAFSALSKLGDITSMDPFEVKVQRLIFDGYPRATAERQVKAQFGLNINLNEDELTPEELAENKIKLEDAQIALKISSKEDASYLQNQLAKIEGNEDKQSRLLAEAAAKEAYAKKLTPFVNQLASSYEKGLSVSTSIGDNKIEYKLDFDDNFRMDIAKQAKEFFLDNEVNDENIRSFKDFANAQYVASKLQSEILPNAIKHGYSIGYKAASDEFQNTSGLPNQGQAPVASNPDALLKEAQRRSAFGED